VEKVSDRAKRPSLRGKIEAQKRKRLGHASLSILRVHPPAATACVQPWPALAGSDAIDA